MFKKCGGKLAWDGRNATSRKPIRSSPTIVNDVFFSCYYRTGNTSNDKDRHIIVNVSSIDYKLISIVKNLTKF